MSSVKLIAGFLFLIAIAEGVSHLTIANADGDPLLALQNVVRGLVVGFGLAIYSSYQDGKKVDKLLQGLKARLERHDEQISKLQGWDD
jgi:hypothetical protein